jgi:hypothetical protein
VELLVVSQRISSNENISDYITPLKRLNSLVSEILYIQDIPNFPTEPLRLFDNPVLTRHEPDKRVPMSKMDKSSFKINQQLADRLTDYGIESLDLTGIYCNANFCSRFSQNKGWLYIDFDHLSVAGASLVAPTLYNYLMAYSR